MLSTYPQGYPQGYPQVRGFFSTFCGSFMVGRANKGEKSRDVVTL